ncbi:hypothetical protein OG909_16460 [Streptomyces sp. NBC_01754]|uniref:hypothetical protein n=1 Tax=Streptomyces sp. NBC_01754 TaxID=2975930 RepID=UPI002DD8A643|nr:hypothetical protein [Streptomyces sp. NBC_01754]WSC93744.1 hypothetical protein OG909_16460 [Streptomyces sp. NBC_01754]
MTDKRDGHKPPSETGREAVQAHEEKKGKSLNWAAVSFLINLWRLVRDWLDRHFDHWL